MSAIRDVDSLTDYIILARVGVGGCCDVYKAIHLPTKRIVAIKNYFKYSPQFNKIKECQKEINLTNSINSKYIAHLKDVFFTKYPKQLYFIYPYSEFDLQGIIRSTDPGYLSIPHISFLFSQILKGLRDIHSSHVLHLDIKPGNILVTPKNKVKIIDFGISQKESDTNHRTNAGTTIYMPPEALLDSCPFSQSNDIWSAGATLYEMITHKPLITGSDSNSALHCIRQRLGYPTDTKSPKHVSPSNTMRSFLKAAINPESIPRATQAECDSAVDMISALLDFSPSKRPSAKQALGHPFIGGLCGRSAPRPPEIRLPEAHQDKALGAVRSLVSEREVMGLRPPKVLPRTIQQCIYA